MRNHPANGVWFLGAESVEEFTIVWTNRDASGAAAIVFHDKMRTIPGSLTGRQTADLRAHECRRWLTCALQSGKPASEWSDPPHDFSMFLSATPGVANAFTAEGHDSPSAELLKMLPYIAKKLGEIWPEWSAWHALNPNLPNFRGPPRDVGDPGDPT